MGNNRSVVRRVLTLGASLLLLALSWWTVAGGVRNLQHLGTIGQQVETVIQLASGLLCIATVLTRFRWRPMHRVIRIAWVVTWAAWVGLAALVWGPPMPQVALLFVVVALLLSWAILWALGSAPTA